MAWNDKVSKICGEYAALGTGGEWEVICLYGKLLRGYKPLKKWVKGVVMMEGQAIIMHEADNVLRMEQG